MRHGVFMAPLHPVDEHPNSLIHRDLELMEWLDRLGFDEAWIGEHHSGERGSIRSTSCLSPATS
jgi:limonene 1,2-monooxygenase